MTAATARLPTALTETHRVRDPYHRRHRRRRERVDDGQVAARRLSDGTKRVVRLTFCLAAVGAWDVWLGGGGTRGVRATL